AGLRDVDGGASEAAAGRPGAEAGAGQVAGGQGAPSGEPAAGGAGAWGEDDRDPGDPSEASTPHAGAKEEPEVPPVVCPEAPGRAAAEEVAVRLERLFWAEDGQESLALLAAGELELRARATVRAYAEFMLRGLRAQAGIVAFVREWFGLPGLSEQLEDGDLVSIPASVDETILAVALGDGTAAGLYASD